MINSCKSGCLQEGVNLIAIYSLRRIDNSEEAKKSNHTPEREIYPKIMAIFKWSDVIKRPRVKVNGPLCGVLYKEDHGSIVPRSGIDTYTKMNSFNCSK